MAAARAAVAVAPVAGVDLNEEADAADATDAGRNRSNDDCGRDVADRGVGGDGRANGGESGVAGGMDDRQSAASASPSASAMLLLW